MGDVTFLCSFMKSGRTYLRFALAHYLEATFRLGVELDFEGMYQIVPNLSSHRTRGLDQFRFAEVPGLPVVVCAHDPYAPQPFGLAPVILLLRAPHDTLTSLYFHEAHHARVFGGTLAELLDPGDASARDATREWAAYASSWAAALPELEHLVITYERLLEDPGRELRRVLELLGLAPDATALATAIERSSFDQMRALELAGRLVPGETYDPRDDRARRVREGKVGGYARHMSPALAARVAARLDELLTDEAKALLQAHGIDHHV